jgi:hypothetical protein
VTNFEIHEHLESAYHGAKEVVEYSGRAWVLQISEMYLRGYHDGSHGRINADLFPFPGHPSDTSDLIPEIGQDAAG